MRQRLPRSLRKFIRRKKAEYRRQFLSSPEEANAKIREFVDNVARQYKLKEESNRRLRA